MASGGARARSGPPPDPMALRRERDVGDWVFLPAAGRKGRTPRWPLSPGSAREAEIWRKMWRKPQALMWERYDQGTEVALYVRRLVESEGRNTPVTLSTLVRQMGDSLGLTTPGLRANRWRIVADPPAEPKTTAKSAKPAAPARPSARSRFKVVRDGDDEES